MLRTFTCPCTLLISTCLPSVSTHVWVTCGEPSAIAVARKHRLGCHNRVSRSSLSFTSISWSHVARYGASRRHLDKYLISAQLGWRHRWVIAEEPRLSDRLPIASGQTREQLCVFRGDLVVICLTGEAQHRERLRGHGHDADSVVARSRQCLQRVFRGHEEAHDPARVTGRYRHRGRHRHYRTLPVLAEDEGCQRHEGRLLLGFDPRARPHISLRGQPGAIVPDLDRTNRTDDLERGLLTSTSA